MLQRVEESWLARLHELEARKQERRERMLKSLGELLHGHSGP